MARKIPEHLRKRLSFIESELYWFGALTKKRIADEFDVADKTVAADLKYYQGRIGGIGLNKQTNRWTATQGFRPQFWTPNSQDYLYRLARAGGLPAPAGDAGVSTAVDVPVYAPPEISRRSVEPECLRRIVQAVRTNGSDRKAKRHVPTVELNIVYRSPNEAEEQTFWIGPHALNHDSFRWAVRAFRSDRERFGDVVLDRIVDVIDGRSSDRDFAGEDEEWNHDVDIVLAPNPGLPAAARGHIEAQCGMQRGLLRVRVKQAFIVYFPKRYQIEEKSQRKAPHQEPLIVKNREEITALIPPRMRVPPEAEHPAA